MPLNGGTICPKQAITCSMAVGLSCGGQQGCGGSSAHAVYFSNEAVMTLVLEHVQWASSCCLSCSCLKAEFQIQL